MNLPALSIQQPFAWAIVFAGKDIENQSWKTEYRGSVLIHAGKRLHTRRQTLAQEMRQKGIELKIPDKLDMGGVVGIAEITGCVRSSNSPWFEGKYGFVIRNARPLPFWPCRGQLGFFKVGVPQRFESYVMQGMEQ